MIETAKINIELKFEGGAALVIFGVILGILYGQLWRAGLLFPLSVLLVFVGIFILSYDDSAVSSSLIITGFFSFIYFMVLLYFTDRGTFNHIVEVIVWALVVGAILIIGGSWFFGGERR